MADKSNKQTRMYNLILAHFREFQAWPTHEQLCNLANIAIKTVKGIIRDLKTDGYIEADYSLNVTGCPFVRTNWLTKSIMAA
jgi:hypothetical protein